LPVAPQSTRSDNNEKDHLDTKAFPTVGNSFRIDLYHLGCRYDWIWVLDWALTLRQQASVDEVEEEERIVIESGEWRVGSR
jgi:hypothetical protein